MKNIEYNFPINWKLTSDSILEAALALKEIKRHSKEAEYKSKLEKFHLPERTARGLLKIASNSRLYDRDIREKLPDKWSTIEIIASLNKSDFELLIANNLLNKGITRSQIYNQELNAVSVKKLKNKKYKFLTIRFDDECLDFDLLVQLKKAIQGAIDNVTKGELSEIENAPIGTKTLKREKIRELEKAKKMREFFPKEEHFQIQEHLTEPMLIKLVKEYQKKATNKFSQIYPTDKFLIKMATKICRSVRQQQKRKASRFEIDLAKNGFSNKGWALEETKNISTVEEIGYGFECLRLNINMEEFFTDKSYAIEVYNSLKMKYKK